MTVEKAVRGRRGAGELPGAAACVVVERAVRGRRGSAAAEVDTCVPVEKAFKGSCCWLLPLGGAASAAGAEAGEEVAAGVGDWGNGVGSAALVGC